MGEDGRSDEERRSTEQLSEASYCRLGQKRRSAQQHESNARVNYDLLVS